MNCITWTTSTISDRASTLNHKSFDNTVESKSIIEFLFD